MASGHSLLMPFDSDEPEFVRGFEAGHVYGLLAWLTAEDVPLEGWTDLMPLTVHAANLEMMVRIAERYGCSVQVEDVDADWINVYFAPKAFAEQA